VHIYVHGPKQFGGNLFKSLSYLYEVVKVKSIVKKR